jgi:hypothetical protein
VIQETSKLRMSPDAVQADIAEAIDPLGFDPQIVLLHSRDRLLKKVFSFPVVLGALLVLITMFTIRSRFSDPDMWWHLKTGEVIWNTHSIPATDLFSFTAYGHPWTAQEWLSELTIFTAWKLGGYTGLMLWYCVLASSLMLAAYLLCTVYSGNCKVAFLGGVAVWLFSTIGLAIRPHMIGYLLLICELLVLHLGRVRNARWFLLLPPLFALWINFHSSFFLGLIVMGVVTFFSFVQFEKGLLHSVRLAPEKRRILVIACGLSIAALFLNPIGPKLAWYPLDVMLNQKIGVAMSQEWQQVTASDFRTMFMLGIGGLVLLVPMLRRIKLTAQELTLVAMGLAFALLHQRMLFVFGVLAAPVLCRLLATAWDRYDPRRDSVLVSAFMLALVGSVIFVAFPSSRSLEQQVEKANPIRALRFLRASGISGRMLNEYVFGGYLIWAAPEHKVFVDGRSDVFEWTGVLADYKNWLYLEADQSRLFDKYHIDFCLLARDTPTTRVMSLLPGWKKVYSDELSAVFTRQKP